MDNKQGLRNGLVIAVILFLLFQFRPQPPGPTPPDPDPTPFPGKTVVLILEETDSPSREKYVDIISSPTMRSFLTTHCTNTDGVPDWRIWDDDYSQDHLARVGPLFQQMYERAKKDSAGKLPWILIQGEKVTSQELPASLEQTMDVLKEYLSTE